MARPDGRASARKSFVFVMMGMMVFFFAFNASADVPHMINYQGKLTDAGGGLVNDTVQMTFSIYPDTLGSPADWSETQAEVEVIDGIFSVLLGAVDTIPSAVFDGNVKYLGVQVESDPEMRPLKPMVSVPYAYRAGSADGGGGASGWVDDGTVVRLETGTDSVGIGTDSPAEKLDVRGNLAVYDISSTQSYFDITDASGTGITIHQGDVGIGTTNPGAKLEIDGEGYNMLTVRTRHPAAWAGIEVRDFMGARTILRAGGLEGYGSVGTITDHPLIMLTNNDEKVRITTSGRLGIGTASPTAELDVSGTVNSSSFYRIGGSTVLSVSGTQNTLVGVGAGQGNSGSYGTFVGYHAGYNNEGNNNTFIGRNVGDSNTSGYGNTFVGYLAGGWNGTGYRNTFLGQNAGYYNTEGDCNTFLGDYAGLDNSAGNYNTFLGQEAGSNNTTGNRNTFLGAKTGHSVETGSSNVFIGYQAGFYATGSNQLYIANGSSASDVLIYGDFSTGNVGIGTTTPTAKLHVANADDMGIYVQDAGGYGVFSEGDNGVGGWGTSFGGMFQNNETGSSFAALYLRNYYGATSNERIANFHAGSESYLRFYFQGDGRAYADLGWSTFKKNRRGEFESFSSIQAERQEIISHGTGKLAGGIAQINFSPSFSEFITDAENIEITVTSLGSYSGLYIAGRTKQGFTVKSGAGDRNCEFTWIAIGVEMGEEERPLVGDIEEQERMARHMNEEMRRPGKEESEDE